MINARRACAKLGTFLLYKGEKEEKRGKKKKGKEEEERRRKGRRKRKEGNLKPDIV